MSSIVDYIKENYIVFHKGEPVDDLSDATEFLLGDCHKDFGVLKINSIFINTFATSEDSVLLEGHRSMELVSKDSLLVDQQLLNTSAKMFGWDAGSPQVRWEMSEIFQSHRSSLSFLLDRMEDHELLRLEKYASRLIDQYPDSTNQEEILMQIATIQQRLSIKHIQHARKIQQNAALFNEMERELFPARTSFMQHSLERAREVSSKTFLTAGFLHLIPEDIFPECIQMGVSIEDFYEFLRTRNVVILYPRPDKVMEWYEKVALPSMLVQRILMAVEEKLPEDETTLSLKEG